MGCRRQDVDLELILQDPKSAREWIRTYQWDCQTPKYIIFGLDQRIHFENMTDAEAVFAANLILRDVEMKRVKIEKQIATDLNEIH